MVVGRAGARRGLQGIGRGEVLRCDLYGLRDYTAELQLHHLRNISMAAEILDWLRFTYGFENCCYP
jgi:hypothetical protein